MFDPALLELALPAKSVFDAGNQLGNDLNGFIKGTVATALSLVAGVAILVKGKFTITSGISALMVAGLIWWIIGGGGFEVVGKLFQGTIK